MPGPLRSRSALIAALTRRTKLSRGPLSHIFIKGSGIEIGSLNSPLDVPAGVKVTYVDRASADVLRSRYPQHADEILPIGIVSEVETLTGIADESQDFVIANHVLEHSEDPIAAFKSIFRVLKPGGIFFLALPDKRFTFDRDRGLTPFEHLVRDHSEGPEVSRLDH
jgi:SAM-dependent methyltransferase